MISFAPGETLRDPLGPAIPPPFGHPAFEGDVQCLTTAAAQIGTIMFLYHNDNTDVSPLADPVRCGLQLDANTLVCFSWDGYIDGLPQSMNHLSQTEAEARRATSYAGSNPGNADARRLADRASRVANRDRDQFATAFGPRGRALMGLEATPARVEIVGFGKYAKEYQTLRAPQNILTHLDGVAADFRHCHQDIYTHQARLIAAGEAVRTYEDAIFSRVGDILLDWTQRRDPGTTGKALFVFPSTALWLAKALRHNLKDNIDITGIKGPGDQPRPYGPTEYAVALIAASLPDEPRFCPPASVTVASMTERILLRRKPADLMRPQPHGSTQEPQLSPAVLAHLESSADPADQPGELKRQKELYRLALDNQLTLKTLTEPPSKASRLFRSHGYPRPSH